MIFPGWRHALKSGVAVGLGAIALTLSGCSSSSPSTADAKTLIGAQLDSVGIAADPGSFSCGDGEVATKGTTVDCSFTANGQPVALVATVASVDGSKVTYSLATKAQPVVAAVLAKSVRARVGAELGAPISSVRCAGDLRPIVKSSATCTLISGGATKDVAVVVTSIDGGVIGYSIGAA